MNPPLSPLEARVLGCLIEKQHTTPEYYPLTLNSLVAACNQKSNRDPAMQVEEGEVAGALDSLRLRKLVWQVTIAGNRVAKYKHALPEALPMSPQEMAVMAELMLRGPQTVSELRIRAQRMASIESAEQVNAILSELGQPKPEPLVARLPRMPGQREERFAHLLCGAPPAAPAPESAPAERLVPPGPDRLSALEAEVAALRQELRDLKAMLGAAETPPLPGGTG